MSGERRPRRPPRRQRGRAANPVSGARDRAAPGSARAKSLALALAVCAVAGCAHRAESAGDSTFEARRQLARELVVRSEWQSAFGYVDQLHRERPRDADVLVLRATVYRERRMLDEAESDLREAIRLAPLAGAAHASLGIVCDLQRHGEEAEAHHRAAAKLEPENATFLNNLGFSLFLHGKVKESVAFYQQAARLSPTSQRTRVNLGFAYAATGEWRRAAREFEMGGSPVEAKVNLGFAYERRGDMANAYALYDEALKLDPRSKRARSDLTHAAEVLGRPLPPAAVLASPTGAVHAEAPLGVAPGSEMEGLPAVESDASESPSEDAARALAPAVAGPDDNTRNDEVKSGGETP